MKTLYQRTPTRGLASAWYPHPGRASAAGAACLALLIAAPATALEPGRELSLRDERVFGTRDGLPQATVTALAQTPDGYLWVGTDGGLARFDGVRFTVFRAENTPALRIHRVRALLVDRQGALWIGTAGGAGLVRHHEGRFEAFEDQLGAPVAVHAAAQAPDGTLWFGTPHGLIRRRGAVFTRLPTLEDRALLAVSSLGVDAAGTLWVGAETGLHRLGEADSASWKEAAGVALGPHPWVHADGDGSVWVVAPGGEVLRAAELGGAARPTARLATRGRRQGALASTRDRRGTLWLGGEDGLMGLHGDGWRLPPPGAKARGAVLALLEDREGHLWVGTRAAGLLRLSHGAFEALPLEETKAGRAVVVQGGRDGTLWLGTNRGQILHVRDAEVLGSADGFGLDVIYALAPDDAGGVWAGGSGAGQARLIHLDGQGRLSHAFGAETELPTGSVVALARLRGDEELLVGTTAGLFRLERGTLTRDPTEAGTTAVYAIHRDRRGVVWLADGAGLGLLHRDDGASLTTPWQRLPRERLSNGQVFSIEEDAAGALWLGTLTGFSRLRDGRVTSWRHGTGFRDDPIFKVLPDAGGNLWLCTTTGVLRVARQALAEHEARPGHRLRYTTYGEDDGLAESRCGESPWNAGWRDPAGTLHFPTGHTIARVFPTRLPATRPAAPPVVEEVRVDGVAVPLGTLGALPPGRGDLEIAYTAPLLGRPERLRFRYRLVPFDDRWIEAENRRAAYYTKVPPGRYQFHVAVSGDTDEGGVSTTTLALVLTPRLDQTWWFRALVGLAGAVGLTTLAAALHRRRLRAVEARHAVVLAERARISRELHDTLAQGFTGISVNLEAAEAWMGKAPDRARQNLDRARALVRASLADARRAVWDMAPEAVERGGVLLALSEAARALDARVPVRTQVNGTPRALPSPLERALARIGQEALTNAIRHAGATNVSLELSYTEEGVSLKVVDDGRGFDPARPSPEGHHGLEGIRARAAEIGGDLRIESRPGGGTVVAVRVEDRA